VHSHSHSIVPLSISVEQRLRAVSHMAGFIGTEAPLFEIRDAGGPATDLLIRSPELGRALAKSLGAANIVLMRGHGSTVTAPSVRLAVYRAVYAELNACYQSEAMRQGPITPLTAEEAAACAASTEGQVHRPWELWTREAAERRRTPLAS
jgi:HCOMODA/2-hydroxy-3-carboxy-muconic semialdehyde decarboxylase